MDFKQDGSICNGVTLCRDVGLCIGNVKFQLERAFFRDFLPENFLIAQNKNCYTNWRSRLFTIWQNFHNPTGSRRLDEFVVVYVKFFHFLIVVARSPNTATHFRSPSLKRRGFVQSIELFWWSHWQQILLSAKITKNSRIFDRGMRIHCIDVFSGYLNIPTLEKPRNQFNSGTTYNINNNKNTKHAF